MKRFYVRNNCPAGTIPDTVLYTVAAGKYKASTQEEANAQAAADTVVNGQAYANLNGSCRPCSYFITKKANSDPPGAFLVNFISDYIGGTTYTFPYSDGMFEQWPFCNIIPAGSYTVRVESMDRLYVTINGVEKQTNTPQTWPAVTPINIQVSTKSLFYNERFDATYTKNDCGTGYVGSSISYPIPAGVASSEISISDANQKAIALYAPSGQAAANATGTCMDATRVIIQRAPGKPAVSTTMRVKLTNSNGIEEMNRVLETDYELPISQVIPQGHHKVTIETMDKVVVSVNGVVKTVRTTETWDYVLGPPLLIEVWWE
jgi:hypothetical protein